MSLYDQISLNNFFFGSKLNLRCLLFFAVIFAGRRSPVPKQMKANVCICVCTSVSVCMSVCGAREGGEGSDYLGGSDKGVTF